MIGVEDDERFAGQGCWCGDEWVDGFGADGRVFVGFGA